MLLKVKRVMHACALWAYARGARAASSTGDDHGAASALLFPAARGSCCCALAKAVIFSRSTLKKRNHAACRGLCTFPSSPFARFTFPSLQKFTFFWFTLLRLVAAGRLDPGCLPLSSAYVVPTHTHARNSAREEGCCARLAFTAAHAKAAARNAGS
jgi:hypothetical protein